MHVIQTFILTLLLMLNLPALAQTQGSTSTELYQLIAYGVLALLISLLIYLIRLLFNEYLSKP